MIRTVIGGLGSAISLLEAPGAKTITGALLIILRCAGGGGGYIGFTPSVRLTVCPSRMPCPLCNAYTSGWILSTSGTNHHYHERVCRVQRPLTLTYIFKVIQPWLSSKTAVYGTFCHVRSTVLDGFFPYLAQMITSMRGCVVCNDLWPWPISSRSFSHDFAVKLLKYGTSYDVRSTARTVLDGFFPCLAQIIISMKGCVACNDFWPWPISSRSISHDFAVKLLKYGTSYGVRSTARAVLDGFFPCLAQIITSMKGCVACSDLWPWPISSRSFSHGHNKGSWNFADAGTQQPLGPFTPNQVHWNRLGL